ncbi:hypothetical protein C0995_004498 [Termitomyces sp. Mi166|nr:hypothetical protein C0995_004498 [Termitomyces sp. Mi166\
MAIVLLKRSGFDNRASGSFVVLGPLTMRDDELGLELRDELKSLLYPKLDSESELLPEELEESGSLEEPWH